MACATCVLCWYLWTARRHTVCTPQPGTELNNQSITIMCAVHASFLTALIPIYYLLSMMRQPQPQPAPGPRPRPENEYVRAAVSV